MKGRVPREALQAGSMGDFKFKVPSGKKAGDEVEIKLPSGAPWRTKIPEGKKAGEQRCHSRPSASTWP